MAVNTTTNKIAYTGNGTTTIFAYNFKILDATHLRVYVNGAVLPVGIGYSVDGVGVATGGTVTFTSAPANGASVVLQREVPLTQPVNTTDNATILSSVLDTALDRLTMQVQQAQAGVDQSISTPVTDPALDMSLPPQATRANKYFYFDANGEPTVIDTMIVGYYYGSLGTDPATRPDGSARVAGDLYFNTALLVIRVFTGTAWANALPTSAITLTNFTELAASAKTTFTITGGYTVGSVFVYLNGALLYPTEYTATDGATVVLGAPCAINDEFRCISFSNFSVADTLSRNSNLNDLPSKPTALVNLGLTATAAELNHVDGVTSPIQTQLDNRVTSNADDFLGAGYTASIVADGDRSSGTYTPSATGANFRYIGNAGAFTLAAPGTINSGTAFNLVIGISNVTGAGAITMSGFNRVTGDAFTTTVGHSFLVAITVFGSFKFANVVALQ